MMLYSLILCLHGYNCLLIVLFTRITDPEQYAALQQQIREFGQIPDQLFTTPHPPKHIQVYISRLLQ